MEALTDPNVGSRKGSARRAEDLRPHFAKSAWSNSADTARTVSFEFRITAALTSSVGAIGASADVPVAYI
jgi:hypothetical protein